MTILYALSKFAPSKRNYLRVDHSRFVNGELFKAVMQKSRLPNGYLSDTHREKTVLFNSAAIIAAQLLLTFFICSHNQLSSLHSIITYLKSADV